MIVKKILIVMLALLWCVSFIQIFSVPPYIGDIFPIYKSGYFKELERNMHIITDSFLNIKTMTKPEYAWIYLDDMQKRHGVSVDVYDNHGRLVKAPGIADQYNNDAVMSMIQNIEPLPQYYVSGRYYYGTIPVKRRTECNFCHLPSSKPLLGVMEFKIPFDGIIYYTSERVILFVIMTFAISSLLFVVIRWNPLKEVQDLFEK